jgi:hypothetical protein
MANAVSVPLVRSQLQQGAGRVAEGRRSTPLVTGRFGDHVVAGVREVREWGVEVVNGGGRVVLVRRAAFGGLAALVDQERPAGKSTIRRRLRWSG